MLCQLMKRKNYTMQLDTKGKIPRPHRIHQMYVRFNEQAVFFIIILCEYISVH